MSRRDKVDTNPLDAAKVPAEEKAVGVVKPSEAVAKPTVAKPSVPKAAPPKLQVATKSKPARYEVVNDVTISWGSSMIRLRPGSVVGDSTHGPGAVEKMRNAGVALKPLEG